MDDLKPILKMYFEGYSQRQISDRLKRSRNTVAEIDELPQGKPQTSIRKNKIQIKGIVFACAFMLAGCTSTKAMNNTEATEPEVALESAAPIKAREKIDRSLLF